MYYDPNLMNDVWYFDNWDEAQQRNELGFFPPIGGTPSFQPPFVTPPFVPRPPRPMPPFFPPTTPGFPGHDASQGIRRCLNRITMIQLFGGRNFWFYPTNITQFTVVGFRWTRNGWVMDSIERRNIQRFECK